MDLWEAYSFVLSDSFMSALLLPIQMDLAFPAMRQFGNHNMLLASLAAILGATAAVFLNVWVGRLILAASKYRLVEEKQDSLSKTIRFLLKRGKFGLLLVSVPVMGALFTVLLGFAQLPLKQVLLWAFIGNALYYMVAAML